MKNFIWSYIIALSAIIYLPYSGVKAQQVQLQEIIEYIDKNGQEYDALIQVSDVGYAPNLDPPSILVLEGDYIYMRATSCTYSDTIYDETGNIYIYTVHLEIDPAPDFGETLTSHIQFRFEFSSDIYRSVDFWTAQPGLDVGSISPETQSILYQHLAQRLTYSSSDITFISSIQWQRKTGNGDWANIPGATQNSYSPGYLTQTTEYRVVARSYGADTGYTDPVIIHVSNRFLGGSISGDQTIFPGNTPMPVTNLTEASGGGSGQISYQWQKKTEQSGWEDIPNATSTSYQPPMLTTTTAYRRKAISGSETAYSNEVTISVKEAIAAYLAFAPVAGIVSEEDRDTRTAGLKTYEKIGILSNDATVEDFIERAFYYDYRGRVIQTVETNHMGGISYYSTQYDFVGNILKSHELHTLDMDPTTLSDPANNNNCHQKLSEFTYDHRSRLLAEKITLDDNSPINIAYRYDKLGQLIEKNIDSSLIVETFDQNLQGWQTTHQVTSGADTLFCTTLSYYDPQFETTHPSYTGNISEWEWRYDEGTETNTYAFTYDCEARLIDSKQYTNGIPNDRYVERGISYDLNGNIRSLRRLAEGAVTANFQYGYAGNRLITLQDSLTSNSYTFDYDANGNMLHDGANDLDLSYNTSNLIKTASKNDEIIAKYSYLADGTKLSVTDAEENGLYYLGSLVYEKHADTLGLESAEFSNGRFVATTNGVEPRYFVTDHLGSVRLVVDCEGNVIEQDTYYPFGLRWSGPLIPVTDNRYRFNGKEDQTFVGLPFLDYGARMYDPERVSWLTQDPLMEKYYSIGQYNYCAGNPVRLIDPTGMSSDEYYNEKGVKIYDTHEGTRTFVIRTSDDKFAGKTAITVSAAQQTEAKITNGELQGDHMQNVVEIAPISTLREARSTIKDDGKGNSSNNPDNHREYGGNILSDNSIADVSEGPTREDNGGKGSISIPGNKDSKATYHSHMSATFVKDGAIKGSSRGPSMTDYKSIQGRQGYIFQMRTQEIIVFDKSGIKATLPFSVLK